MKFLVDMNVSPRWVAVFNAAGFPAEHWTNIGDARASDAEIMDYARAHDYVVVTRDLDFSAMLAVSGAGHPSVVQIRADTADLALIGDVVLERCSTRRRRTRHTSLIPPLPFAVE